MDIMYLLPRLRDHSLMLLNRLHWRNLGILACLLAPMLWPLQQFAERYYHAELAEQNRQTLDLYVANLRGILRRYEVLPSILGDLPRLRLALLNPQPEPLQAANQLLQHLRQESGADVIYLMDTQGNTLAASNWHTEHSFTNRNFAFRPYFQQALAQGQGRFFGLGTASGKRGYFFSAAIRHQGMIIGVLVIKVDLDHTENLWGKTPEQLVVTDDRGVIILTSRPDWRFRATRRLTAEELKQIAQHRPYPTDPLQELALSKGDWQQACYPDSRSQPPKVLEIKHKERWLIHCQTLPETGWMASILAPTPLAERPVRTVVIIGATTLLALLLCIGLLMQRRQHFMERLEANAHTRRELEQRVAERTRDLQGLNQQLKDEILEREYTRQELVRAQDELLQAGKLSALGTMSASISHELNQPLGAIRTYADNAKILLDQQRLEEARSNLQLISDLTTRMASIITHLRGFARRDQKAPERVALQPALEDSLRLLEPRLQQLNVHMEQQLPTATCWVQAGETRLRQILSNLLNNALDALAERETSRHLWLQGYPVEQGVLLLIRDNGPGFTLTSLERAREPFFTTKTRTEGLGLGLAICTTLTTSLGGRLQLGNHPEGGAQVELFLLTADTEPPFAPRNAP